MPLRPHPPYWPASEAIGKPCDVCGEPATQMDIWHATGGLDYCKTPLCDEPDCFRTHVAEFGLAPEVRQRVSALRRRKQRHIAGWHGGAGESRRRREGAA